MLSTEPLEPSSQSLIPEKCHTAQSLLLTDIPEPWKSVKKAARQAWSQTVLMQRVFCDKKCHLETGMKQSVSVSLIPISCHNGIFGCMDMKCIAAGKQKRWFYYMRPSGSMFAITSL